MKPFLNFRNVMLIALTIALVILKFVTDPTAGAVTQEFLLYVSTPILVVLLGHWLRKLLFPYVDMGDLYDQLKTSAVGAGLGFVGMCIFVFAIYGLFGPSARAQDVTTYIPVQAYKYAPVLVTEQERVWESHQKLGSLVV